MIGGFLNVVGVGSTKLHTQLKTGELVTFRVRSQVAPDTWLVSLKGKQVQVRAEVPLSAGDLLKARAHFERGQLFLKLITHQQTSAAERYLQRHGITPSPTYKHLLEALMRSELPLREEIVSYAARALFASRRSDSRRLSRFLAVMIDKGLRPSPEKAEELYQAVEEPPDHHQERGRGRHHDDGAGEQNRRQQEKRRQLSRKEPASQQDEKAGADRPPRAEDIRLQCLRAAEQENSLQLWNHAVGPHDNWIVVPLAWEHGGERIEGRARIRIVGGKADRFTLSVYARNQWHFAVSLADRRNSITVYSDSRKVQEQAGYVLEALRENLHNKEVEIDDIIRRERDFDRFENGAEADMRGVDRMA